MPSDLGPRDPLRAIYEREQRRPPRRIYAVVGAVAVLGAFIGIVYYAYHEGIRAGSESVAPLIRADQQPYKVKPEDPGGMDIPNQDKLIYNEVAPSGAQATRPGVERLMPPPESPLPRPSPEAVRPAQAQNPTAAPKEAPIVPKAGTRPAGTPAYVPLPPAPVSIPPVSQVANAPPPATPATPPAQRRAAPAANAPAPSSATAPVGQSGTWRVQLGSVRSSEDAQREWGRLQKQHADLLGALTLNVQRADLGGDKGVFFRIQGGPLTDRDVANALCDRLKAARVGCLAVKQ